MLELVVTYSQSIANHQSIAVATDVVISKRSLTMAGGIEGIVSSAN